MPHLVSEFTLRYVTYAQFSVLIYVTLRYVTYAQFSVLIYVTLRDRIRPPYESL